MEKKGFPLPLPLPLENLLTDFAKALFPIELKVTIYFKDGQVWVKLEKLDIQKPK